MKKRSSIEERLKFAEEMMDEIMDSADRPTEGRQWWTKSDEPWQTLAACKEVHFANSVMYESFRNKSGSYRSVVFEEYMRSDKNR